MSSQMAKYLFDNLLFEFLVFKQVFQTPSFTSQTHYFFFIKNVLFFVFYPHSDWDANLNATYLVCVLFLRLFTGLLKLPAAVVSVSTL